MIKILERYEHIYQLKGASWHSRLRFLSKEKSHERIKDYKYLHSEKVFLVKYKNKLKRLDEWEIAVAPTEKKDTVKEEFFFD